MGQLRTWWNPPLDAGWMLIAAGIALAAALREISYACHAAATTAALAFLYGYFGQGRASLLGHRHLGVAVGAVIGIGVAWFVLPVTR